MRSFSILATTVVLVSSTFAQEMPWSFEFAGKREAGRGTKRCQQVGFKFGEKFSFQAPSSYQRMVKRGTDSIQAMAAPCNAKPHDPREYREKEESCNRTKESDKKSSCWSSLDKKKREDAKKTDECVKRREKECASERDDRRKADCYGDLARDKVGGNKGGRPPSSSPPPGGSNWGSLPPPSAGSSWGAPPPVPAGGWGATSPPPPPPSGWVGGPPQQQNGSPPWSGNGPPPWSGNGPPPGQSGPPPAQSAPPPPPPKPQTKCCLRLYSDRNCKNAAFEGCGNGAGYAQGDVGAWNILCT